MGDNESAMKRWRVALLLAACFAFRLLFGLSREFFFEDETQIFLLGFRYYATAAWPFFGPDVVWTRSEIPGALQALLVGVPLKLIADPRGALRPAQPAVVRGGLRAGVVRLRTAAATRRAG